MKKLLSAIALVSLSQSVLAIETGQVNSYSYQGSQKSVVRSSAKRAVPAPSAWTPPERIPSAPVTLYRKSQPKKLGGGFGFSSPSFSSPALSSPTFSAPAFSSPTYANPGFSAPSTAAPSFSSPTLSAPAYSSPNLSSPGFSSPSL
jgi:hypothetical protein